MKLPGSRNIVLTVTRAEAIVSHAESDFASGRQINDAFVPFSVAGAGTRSEARAAMLLTIANFFRLAQAQCALEDFNDYVRVSRLIATRIMCDEMRDEAQLHQAALSYGREFESFIAYLRTQDSASADYWPHVYERLELPYPSELTRCEQIQSHTKPWWRFW